MSIFDYAEEKVEEPCPGKIYKCKINSFINGKGEVIFKTSLVPMKKLSCKGCESCGYLEDELKEFIANESGIIFNKPEDGKLYKLTITNMEKDFETGYVDDYDLAFLPIK